MKFIISSLVLLTSLSFSAKAQRFPLDGKIIYSFQYYYYGRTTDSLKIVSYKKNKSIKLYNTNSWQYRNPKWMQNSDNLYIQRSKRDSSKVERFNQLCIIDSNGSIVEELFQSNKGMQVSNYVPSPNDSLLIFNYTGSSPEHFCVFDIKHKNVIKSVNVNNTHYLKESIWSPTSDKFLISLKDQGYYKIFLFDLKNNDSTFIANGHSQIFHPFNPNLIAYSNTSFFEKNSQILFFDLITKQSKVFYQASKKERIMDFRFTPDGKFLLINCSNSGEGIFWKPYDRLVNIETSENFKAKGHRLIETWKY